MKPCTAINSPVMVTRNRPSARRSAMICKGASSAASRGSTCPPSHHAVSKVSPASGNSSSIAVPRVPNKPLVRNAATSSHTPASGSRIWPSDTSVATTCRPRSDDNPTSRAESASIQLRPRHNNTPAISR